MFPRAFLGFAYLIVFYKVIETITEFTKHVTLIENEHFLKPKVVSIPWKTNMANL